MSRCHATQSVSGARQGAVGTDLSARALVVERAERNGGQQDGDVQEDGRGHVLQQGLVVTHDACRGRQAHTDSHRKNCLESYLKNVAS